MRQERRGVFETNSSSTHSICIATNAIDKAMVELAVDYAPNYSVNDSFEDAIEQFLTPAA